MSLFSSMFHFIDRSKRRFIQVFIRERSPAIERVKEKFQAAGVQVDVVGMDTQSRNLVKQANGS
ncbi:hypothetical protein NSQ36_01010 [Bacillus sp. FSL W8-1143]|uniref:hypothetical protein n=1 Tax=Bacillus TaxID=1386 RepID=UPI00203F7446|nr:hypothetical protein [Bacillus pumilus]MCM3149307.1 hypothetical protein [Bacillus pumilus]MDR6749349.1 hypothetical protein [Bacillus pumilus]MDR7250028.1 hypothetical protein [Bacillus pumilus]